MLAKVLVLLGIYSEFCRDGIIDPELIARSDYTPAFLDTIKSVRLVLLRISSDCSDF